MKIFVTGMSTLCLCAGLCFFAAAQDVPVRGYTKTDGTYVQPHFRTRPNETLEDNYSTRGNVNPYTGKAGTVRDAASGDEAGQNRETSRSDAGR